MAFHRERCCRVAKPRSAFTLVEVLVVISIIGILVAVLLPTLAESRESARRMLCATTYRSYGAAIPAFAADQKDRMSTVQQASSANSWWDRGGGASNNGWGPYAGILPGLISNSKAPAFEWPSFMQNYIGGVSGAPRSGDGLWVNCREWTSPIFRCPSRAAVIRPVGNGSQHVFISYFTYWANFTMYRRYSPFGQTDYNIHYQTLSDVSTPVQCKRGGTSIGLLPRVLMSDAVFRYSPLSSGSQPADEMQSNHARGGVLEGGNILFPDGSVQWRNRDGFGSLNWYETAVANSFTAPVRTFSGYNGIPATNGVHARDYVATTNWW